MASYFSHPSNSRIQFDRTNSNVHSNTTAEMDTFVLNMKCQIHTGGQVKSFCEDHDVVICEDCSRYDHRKCENVADLGKMSKGVKQHQEYKNTTASLHNLKDDLEKLKMTRQDDKTRLGQEKKEIELKMRETVKKIQEKLVTLMQKGTNELENKYKEFEEDINKDLKGLEETLAEVNKAIKGLQEDEKDAFINMKTSKNITKDAKKTIKGISGHARKETLQFTLNPAITDTLSQKELGTLSFENKTLPPKPRLFHEVCEYNASRQGTYNVNINKDQITCHILDSCLLHDGTMVLTDLPHNLLIHIDQTYKLKGFCETPGEPWGICTVSKTKIAVTLIGRKAVQLVSTEESLVLKKSFDVGLPCRGIFFKDGNMFVCCGGGSSYWRSVMEGSGQVRVYNLQGLLLYTIRSDEKGKQILGRPRDIILNPENNLFYVTDETNGVIVLSRTGQRVSTIKEKNLIAARGITFDSRGQMFVGCMKSGQVFMFNGDGTLIQTLVTKSKDESFVRSLCFKADSYRLIVTGHCNEIQVLDLARR